jgi:hypothetical protein
MIRQIFANEDDPRIDTGRPDCHIDLPARMQTDTGAGYFFL